MAVDQVRAHVLSTPSDNVTQCAVALLAAVLAVVASVPAKPPHTLCVLVDDLGHAGAAPRRLRDALHGQVGCGHGDA